MKSIDRILAAYRGIHNPSIGESRSYSQLQVTKNKTSQVSIKKVGVYIYLYNHWSLNNQILSTIIYIYIIIDV